MEISVTQQAQAPTLPATTQVLLGDSMGELMGFFAASDIAVVGGSVVPNIGGHNVLEPASLRLPTITGQYVHNFATIASQMQREGALTIATDTTQLQARLAALVTDESSRTNSGTKAYEFFCNNCGSLAKTIAALT
jgi:3-deoxy-D-manno-octulosonic-acid transferase